MENLFLSHTSVTNNTSPDTIHVHNAPVADQVRLLNEMQEAAQKNVLGAYRVEINNIKATVVVLRTMEMGPETIMLVKANMNGQDYEEKFTIQSWQEDRNDLLSMVDNARKAMAQWISESILQEVACATSHCINITRY